MLDLSKKYLKKDINTFKMDDILKLQDLISYHSDLYYNKENPIISDFEYDELFKKLTILEKEFNITNKQTSLVWADLIESSFAKVKHSRPMISLDNTYNEDDLNDFNDRINKLSKKSIPSPLHSEVLPLQKEENKGKINYTLEFKFDWLWVELIYKEWNLVQAITRGNWIEWEDVTRNIMQIENIPKTIDYKDHLEVRGEVVMPISVFNELNNKAKIEWTKVFSNPRNAASWSVRMKDNRITKQRKLKFFAYDLANFTSPLTPLLRGEGNDKVTYYWVIKWLEKLWFEISSYFLNLNWISEVIKSIENFWDIKKTIDFEIDWLVLKVNDISLWQEIWFTEHHPRYAISYKFPAEILTTKILSVEHSVWRTWTITPVANLEAINIWWVVVRRATLHNYEEVESLGVRIWDTVFIKRAWEVIPKIVSVVKQWDRDSLEKIEVPKYCPSCETEVKKDEDKVRYYCPNNIDCPAKHHEKLTFAVWKQWFNIDWLWEKQIETFLDNWIINNLVDVFKISEKQVSILDLEGFKEKSVQNLIEWIEKAKKMEVSTLITALWIPWVGKKTAKTLSKLFKSKSDLLNFSENIEDLELLEDIWPEIAKNVIEYLWNDAHKRILSELVEILDITYYKEKELDMDAYFFQKKVCITWSFDWFSRDELAEKLESIGWVFVSSVSKKTDFLLAWNKAGSKLKKAWDLWVEVIDLEYFLEKIK